MTKGMQGNELKYLKFGYIASVVYLESGEVGFQAYDTEDKGIYRPLRIVAIDALPLLIFQLVDAGYLVHKITDKDGRNEIRCYSPQWFDDQEKKQKADQSSVAQP